MLLFDAVRKYGWLGISNDRPNGHNYFVDANHANALDANDGEHGTTWELPFATLTYAITRCNVDSNVYGMNNIYVNAATYSAALTVLPKNCNIIGVGARTRITGANTVVAAAQNCHFWNIWFRGSGAYPLITIPTTTYGGGFHGCMFEGTASATYAISLASTNDFIIEDCKFQGNPLAPVAINITALQIRLQIRRNWIGATTSGIQIFNGTGCYGNIIADNYISRLASDPNSSLQMAYGIKMLKTTGTSKYLIINNRIEAVDAIYSATDDDAFDNQCIGNMVVEAAVAAFEDAIPTA